MTPKSSFKTSINNDAESHPARPQSSTRQAMDVERRVRVTTVAMQNQKACILHILSVSTAFIIQRMRHIVTVACPSLQNFSTFPHKTTRVSGGKIY